MANSTKINIYNNLKKNEKCFTCICIFVLRGEGGGVYVETKVW
jgi:hypothetical protein